MREVFQGWRRKLGVVTLLVAMLTMGAWFRSAVVTDYFWFPFDLEIGGHRLEGLAAEHQSLVLYVAGAMPKRETEPEPEDAARVDSSATIPDSEPMPQEPEPADASAVTTEATSIVVEWLRAEQAETVNSREAGCLLPKGLQPYSAAAEGWIPPRTTYISCYFPEPVPWIKVYFGWIVFPLTLLSAWLILSCG